MVSKLYVNGCSWTAGDELNLDKNLLKYVESNGYRISKDYSNYINEHNHVVGHLSDFYNKFNWGSRICELLDINEYVNDAVGGGSNERIFRTTIEFLMNCSEEYKKNLLVIIGWTSSDRREVFIKSTKTYEKLQGGFEFSKTISHPIKINRNLMDEYNRYHRLYYEHMYSYFDSIMKYSQHVYSMSNILENLKVKYVFFNSIESCTNIDWSGESKYLNTFFNWKANNSNIITSTHMQDFVIKNGYEIGPQYHPLSDGHNAWGDFVHEHIIRNNILQ